MVEEGKKLVNFLEREVAKLYEWPEKPKSEGKRKATEEADWKPWVKSFSQSEKE